jgi:hypothetical protein
MREIADKYIQLGQPWPATTRQIARWAIEKGLWQPQPSAIIDRCADELARAMREDYITDPQGRRVRAKHAARVQEDGEQATLWADIRTASREHMAVALQQRRQQVVGDCWQLKCDVDSYNENMKPSEPIQMIFDFTDDMVEMEAVA